MSCCAGAASVELVSGPASVTDTAATGRKYEPGFLFNSAGASHNSYTGGTENLLLLAAWTIKLKLWIDTTLSFLHIVNCNIKHFVYLCIWEGSCRKEILMQELSVNLPPLGASTELISCANGLKFKTLAVPAYATLLSLTWWESDSLEWSNTSPKKRQQFWL